ncbi:MAG: hypothetical protein PHR31_02090 [Candidatus Pacebacteria bacterium]|nr:hypothetical protein [Candidatus Paceibacterota bacterium]
MKKRSSYKSKKIDFKKIPYRLAQRSFWIFLILFLLSALLIFVFLYRPVKNQKEIMVGVEKIPEQFDEETFRQVLEQWKIRQDRLKKTDQKDYPDIFIKQGLPASSNPTSTASSTINATSSPANAASNENKLNTTSSSSSKI